MNVEESAKRAGFTSADEMLSLVAQVDLTVPQARADFQEWKSQDGTKDGLLRRFPGLGGP